MRKISSVAVLALILVVSCGLGCVEGGGRKIRGSGHVTRETHDLGHFNGVALRTSGNLRIEMGDRETLRIEAEENLHEYLEFEIDDGVLEIKTRRAVNLKPTKPINFFLAAKELDTIHLSGSGDIEAPDLEAERVRIRVSGSGDIEIDGIEADEIDVHVSGSGDVTILEAETEEQYVEINGSGDVSIDELNAESVQVKITGSGDVSIPEGSIDRQQIAISGSGSYSAKHLDSAEAEVLITGSGSATVMVEDLLEATLTGSGDVYYDGRPEVMVSASGSGRVGRM